MTPTGRLYSSEPEIQNLWPHERRTIFFEDLDFSEIEMRIIASLSQSVEESASNPDQSRFESGEKHHFR